jgi:hypothetical protein
MDKKNLATLQSSVNREVSTAICSLRLNSVVELLTVFDLICVWTVFTWLFLVSVSFLGV